MFEGLIMIYIVWLGLGLDFGVPSTLRWILLIMSTMLSITICVFLDTTNHHPKTPLHSPRPLRYNSYLAPFHRQPLFQALWTHNKITTPKPWPHCPTLPYLVPRIPPFPSHIPFVSCSLDDFFLSISCPILLRHGRVCIALDMRFDFRIRIHF